MISQVYSVKANSNQIRALFISTASTATVFFCFSDIGATG